MFKQTNTTINFPNLEKEILSYWEKEGIVNKYLNSNSTSSKIFSFLDGPITANNPMGVHHAWGRTYKDLWQRFYTMLGFRQRYQNGFDCQGLWVEVEVEKELGIRNKKDIENLVPGNSKESIAKFINLCKERVIKFSKVQTDQSKRLAYFMDWDKSYFTMSEQNNYMIWHFLKECYKKAWIYKGRDSVPWCPRCETAISQHEMLTEDYKELTHETIFFKLPVLNKDFSLVAWTTTPWTIPANVVLAVNPNYKYRVWKYKGEKVVIVSPVYIKKGDEFDTEQFQWYEDNVMGTGFIHEGKVPDIEGKDLVGLKYRGPFDELPIVKAAQKENPKTFHTVVAAEDLVVGTKGTGILHVAPGAGQEDFKLGKEKNLSVISVIADDASYLNGLGEFSGKNAKKHPELIIDYLKKKDEGKYFIKTLRFTHRYPACWRCKTELVWKVADEWYIAMDRKDPKDKKTFREKMQNVAKKINWMPNFGMERELDWLSNMHDWLISKKNRYWGLALPIYECNKCGSFEVIGGREELKQRAVSGWEKFVGNTPHKPWIDEVKIKCQKCQNIISRTNDVGNPWLDAGIVPFSTISEDNSVTPLYKKDRKQWEKWYPADFITESFPGQFKNWFYALIAMSGALENTNPFKTVLGFATLLAENGKPMHKSSGNMIEFNQGADQIGVDVMRWMYIRQNPSHNLLFGYNVASDVRRKVHIIYWNSYNFFITYANIFKFKKNLKHSSKNILDKWIISRLFNTLSNTTSFLKTYEAYKAAIIIEEFISDLSIWYIRRSRGRINAEFGKDDQEDCLQTLYKVFVTSSKMLAPMIPFISEEVYRNLTSEESVHLSKWPELENDLIDNALEKEMTNLRLYVEDFHRLRKINNLRIRVPVVKAAYLRETSFNMQMQDILKAELNVKNIEQRKQKVKDNLWQVSFDKENILYEEGEARDIIRKIQSLRKEQKLGLKDKIKIILPSWPEKYEDYIKDKTLAVEIRKGEKEEVIKTT